MKNEMLITNDQNWNGIPVIDIKRWAVERDSYTKQYKEMKKEILLWNKMSKSLCIANPELVAKWKEHTSHGDQYEAFVWRIYQQLKAGRLKLEEMGKIESLDNGSRGTARTLEMQLWHINGESILDASREYQYKYYYL